MIMTGSPFLFQSMGDMGLRVRSDSEVTITFAVEPMIVPFPPKPAPKAKAHHYGVTSIPIVPNS